MTIILFTKTGAKPIRLQLTKKQIVACATGCGTLVLALFAAFFWAGGSVANHTKADGALIAMQDQLQAQSVELNELREKNDKHLDALALQLGRLQARSTRLEALGERLITLGQIDDGEFDFSSVPALGGPEVNDNEVEVGNIDVAEEIIKLETRFARQSQQLGLLELMIANRELEEDLRPSGRPTTKGWLSSLYGKRVDPIDGSADFHPGMDFSGNYGDDVISVASGVVTWSGMHADYGNYVDIDHGNGYMTRYGHNQENLVEVGDRVRAGELIAKMGSTGRTTGPHVHFEVWYQGRRINPKALVSNN